MFEINELKRKIEEGKQAEKKLQKYQDIIDRIEFLEGQIKSINNNEMRKITIEVGYNSSIAFKVEDKEVARKLITGIMENEVETLKNKLKFM